MGDLFKKNFKRLTGVRGKDPVADLEIVRVIDISGGGATSVALSGDLSGTSDASTVVALQGNPVATGTPASGEVLTWDGSQWVAQSGGSTVTSLAVGGDLNGTTDNATVDGLQGRDVAATAPASGEALVWNGSAWAPGAVASTSAGAGTINSSELVSVTGTSGNVTDSDTFVLVTNTSSVSLTLLGPFTDGKVIYIKDGANGVDRATNPITITPDSGTIDFDPNVQIINTNQSVPLVHISGAWYIF
jgi:hypothetical protein